MHCKQHTTNSLSLLFFLLESSASYGDDWRKTRDFKYNVRNIHMCVRESKENKRNFIENQQANWRQVQPRNPVPSWENWASRDNTLSTQICANLHTHSFTRVNESAHSVNKIDIFIQVFFFFLRFCFAFFYSKKTYCLLDAIMAPERFVISCIMGEKTKRARWTKENVITHNRHYFNFIFWKINTHTMTKEVENRHAGKGWSEMGVLWANEKKVGKKSARSRREKQEK